MTQHDIDKFANATKEYESGIMLDVNFVKHQMAYISALEWTLSKDCEGCITPNSPNCIGCTRSFADSFVDKYSDEEV